MSQPMIVTIIGLSAVLVGRIQLRRARQTTDLAQARLNALSAVDLGLLAIDRNPASWRMMFASAGGGPLPGQSLADGSFELLASDPVDGDLLNNNIDPVLLTGIGYAGQARYKLQVRVEANGLPAPGTWRQAVD